MQLNIETHKPICHQAVQCIKPLLPNIMLLTIKVQSIVLNFPIKPGISELVRVVVKNIDAGVVKVR